LVQVMLGRRNNTEASTKLNPVYYRLKFNLKPLDTILHTSLESLLLNNIGLTFTIKISTLYCRNVGLIFQKVFNPKHDCVARIR
jgi:hypothetical protein